MVRYSGTVSIGLCSVVLGGRAGRRLRGSGGVERVIYSVIVLGGKVGRRLRERGIVESDK